ncbi:MAG: STAS domain-containing protein [Desulfurivibrio sp.]|nr:STAS domain-containing protein [Desulfurivibrio sp.]
MKMRQKLLKSHINSLPPCQFREIIIDLSGLTYIGSSGIGKFLLLYKSLAGCYGTMRLTGTPIPIAELLHSMKLGELFEIDSTDGPRLQHC